MAKTYCTCIGMRGERTARGGYDGCRASVQSYDGSIIVSNYIDREDNSLHEQDSHRYRQTGRNWANFF